MRAPTMADIESGIRVLLAAPVACRPALARTLCEQAHVADRFCKAHGTPHPHYGTGTLMAASSTFRQVPRCHDNPRDFITSMGVLVAALIAFHDNQHL
ncbi:MAG: hypothetical protein AAF801_00905 [Pseudomonadota bacterium]